LIERTVFTKSKLPKISLRYGPEDVVYQRGAPAQFLYVVRQGALCGLKMLPDGRRQITRFLLPGDGFGYELGRRHDETVLALADTEIDAASKLALLEAAKSDPVLSMLLFAVAARAAMVAKEHSLMLLNRTTAEQVALFLLEMDVRLAKRGEIALPMRRQYIADYLGRRIESVSRTFTAFHGTKIIEFLDNPKIQRRVAIRDKDRLRQIAGDASDFRWGKP
jgi:CRP/FNR family transcriptional regulator